MRFLLSLLFLIFVILLAVAMLILHFLRRGVKNLQDAAQRAMEDEEAFKRMSDKHYRHRKSSGAAFDEDYFKTTKSQSAGCSDSFDSQYDTAKEQSQARTTTTSEGVTIIDERSRNERKKIFADNEGEYVTFTEE